MSDRSQSDVIGIVLLTLIVTVTVTGTGAVTLNEFQSDIDDEPLADIESTLTTEELTLEHVGGSTLDAEDVTVQIENGDETYSLTEFDGVSDQFYAGIRASSDAIETRSGGVTVRVIHEPSQKVLHEKLHDLGFPFLIGGKTGSVFMVPGDPVSYTAPDTAAVTPDDGSVVSVDESAKNVSGVMTGATTVTANGYSNTKTVDVQVIDHDQLGVKSYYLNALDSNTLAAKGNLSRIGALDKVDLYVRYWRVQPVALDAGPADNSDEVIVDGEYHSSPEGYSHNNDGWLHDNTPLLPGTNRTYKYTVEATSPRLFGTVRDEEWTTPGTFSSYDDAVEEMPYGSNRMLFGDDLPQDEPFEIRVAYSEDGSTVRFYLNGTLKQAVTDQFDGYNELYFSTLQDQASSVDQQDRVRAISVPGTGARQTELVESGVESPTNYSYEITGASPGETYLFEPYAEREITNAVINDSGMLRGDQTEGLVETLDETEIGAASVRLRGDLINSLGDTDLSFVVVRASDDTVVARPTVDTDVDTPQQFNTTVSGLQQNTTYRYYARADDTTAAGVSITATGDNVTFTTSEPVVETLDVNTTGADTINATGELVDIARLDETNLYFRYRKQQPIALDAGPADNSDEVIADGEYHPDPEGYSHNNNGWVHDNTPLVPGTNRTYEYVVNDASPRLFGSLRDEEWTTPGTFSSYSDAVAEMPYSSNRVLFGDDLPQDEPFEIRVAYSKDGSTVRFYLNGNLEAAVTDQFDGYHELYFSTLQDSASRVDQQDRIRAITVPEFSTVRNESITSGVDTERVYSGDITGLDPDTLYAVEAYSNVTVGSHEISAVGAPIATRTDSSVETDAPTDVAAESARLHGELKAPLGDTDLSFVVVRTSDDTVVADRLVEPGVDTPQQFNTTVSGLREDTNYTYYARAEGTDSNGIPVTDTGTNVTFTSDKPEIETLSTEGTGSDTANVTANLTDLGGLGETNVSIRYRKQQPVALDAGPADNSDEVIADGQQHSSPDGYSHSNNGFIHDNTPLYPGTNRTYTYMVNDTRNRLFGTLRDEEWTTRGTFSSFDDALEEMPYGTNRVLLGSNFPTNRPLEVRVAYSEDGSTVRFYVDGSLEATVTDQFDDYNELYFSTEMDQARNTDPEDQIRAISVPAFGTQQTEFVTRVDTTGIYTGELSGLDPSTVYVAEARSSTSLDGQYFNATGGRLGVETDP